MTLRTKAISSLSAVLCLLLVFAAAAAAQTVTTGNIAGTRDRHTGRRPARRDGDGRSHAHGHELRGRDGCRRTLQRAERACRPVHRQRRDDRLQGAEAGSRGRGARPGAHRRLQAADCDRQRDGRSARAEPANRSLTRGDGRQHLECRQRESPDDLAQPDRHRAHQPAVRRAGERRRRWSGGLVGGRATAIATTRSRSTAR